MYSCRILRIIMYLPSDDAKERMDITNRFKGQYCDLSRDIGKTYGTVSHWGKLEMPNNIEDSLELQRLINSRYPTDKFSLAREVFDPKNILGNDLMDLIFSKDPWWAWAALEYSTLQDTPRDRIRQDQGTYQCWEYNKSAAEIWLHKLLELKVNLFVFYLSKTSTFSLPPSSLPVTFIFLS